MARIQFKFCHVSLYHFLCRSRLMQHRSDLILEASKSILEHFPSLKESEVNRMANEGLVAHLEASGNSLNRQFNRITFEDITNFLCNGIGNMACNGVMNSPYR